MRLLPLLGLLLPLSAFAQAKAPPPGEPLTLTPAQDAAQEMILVYEEFCLTRFPSAQAMEDGIVAHRMAAASAAEAGAALLGRPGTAWRLTTTKGSYLVATESGDRKGCAVVGDVADDSGVRAAFDLLVSSFIAGHDLGTPDKLPVQNGQVHGEPAALQLIGVTPGRLAKQAFVNMATGKGPVMHVRLTREFGPPGG